MLKRFILWDYPRASWQYDVMVGIILAFIFLTPRDWFLDQPRTPDASEITMLPGEHGHPQFFVPEKLLADVPDNQRLARLTQLLQTRRHSRSLLVTRVEPILNSEGELQGYMAFAKP
jgi:hypothetical protein